MTNFAYFNHHLSERMLQTTATTADIDELNERAWELRSGEIAEPLSLSHEAYSLSAELGYERGLACSLRNLGYFYSRQCEFEKSLKALQQSAELAVLLGDNALLSSVYNNLGVLFLAQENYPEALDIFKKNLSVIEKTGNVVAKALTLNNIGNIYWALENFPEMLNSYFSALKSYEALGEESGMATIYISIGNTYKVLKNYDKARENYQKSLQLHLRYGNMIGAAIAQSNLAMLHLLEGNFALAKEMYLEALGTQQLLGEDPQIARIYTGLGIACKGLSQFEPSIHFFQRALEISLRVEACEIQVASLLELGTVYFEMQDIENAAHSLERIVTDYSGQRPECYRAHKILSEICAKKGDFKSAWEHHKQFHDGFKEHKNDEAEDRFKKLFMSFEVERAQRETELYRQKSEELGDALMELKAVHTDFKKLSDARNEMLGIVAHDLKNPLTGIMLWAEVLEQRLSSSDAAHNIVQNILKTALHMSAIIRELLDTRLEESESAMSGSVSVDAVAVVREVIEGLHKAAALKNITLHHSLPENIALKTDPISLRRVVENLLSNAVKFSPLSSNVFLKLFKNSDELHFIVEDEGPGVSAEDMKKLFKKFSRLSARPTGGEHSTGLGLYIVDLLITKMGGTIHCESLPGKGTRFIVKIPLSDF